MIIQEGLDVLLSNNEFKVEKIHDKPSQEEF
jgi:hypothetical protein